MCSCGTGPTDKTGNQSVGPFATVADGIPEAKALRSAGFAVLRQGKAATPEHLARSTGIQTPRVREALAAMARRGATELDEDGRLVGIGGLSLVPTRHELVLDGVPLYTWCAFDALGIPPAAAADAQARSRCAACGQSVEVTFSAGRPQGTPAVITWFPRCPSASNVRRDFCEVANLFCSRGHLDAWRESAGNPPGEALTVAEVADRGRANWAHDARWVAPS